MGETRGGADNTLNTFYLLLYGSRLIVKDHSDSERGNPPPPHGLLFSINSKGSLYVPSNRESSIYHNLCYNGHGKLAGMGNSPMGPP